MLAPHARGNDVSKEGAMPEIERIGVVVARSRVQAKTALLVCAYPDEVRWNQARLEGAIPLTSLEAQAATMPLERLT